MSGASSLWLWHTLELNQAHSAVTSHRKSLMIAKSWNLHSGLCARLEGCVGAINLNRLTINVDVESLSQVLRWSENCE